MLEPSEMFETRLLDKTEMSCASKIKSVGKSLEFLAFYFRFLSISFFRNLEVFFFFFFC